MQGSPLLIVKNFYEVLYELAAEVQIYFITEVYDV